MAFTRVKIGLTLVLVTWLLSGCGDFRAIFNGKPSHSVAKAHPPPEKNHSQPVPEAARGFFAWPLNAPISSPYGKRGGRFHDGIDIDGESGDDVVASAAGKVVFSGQLGGYGNLIVIQHPNGFFTAYAHNKKNLVKRGKEVKQGQLIAVVGSTGQATGAHLHFEIRDQKGTYDPLAILPKPVYSRR